MSKLDNFKGKEAEGNFSKHPENIGGGRKKKIYTILKEKGYSADDIKTAFGELAFYTLKELKTVSDDEAKPIITRIIAKQFNLAFTNGDWNKVREILEHVIGKPNQSIEFEDKTPKVSLSKAKTGTLEKLENELDA